MSTELSKQTLELIEKKSWEYSQFDQAVSVYQDAAKEVLTDPKIISSIKGDGWVEQPQLPIGEEVKEGSIIDAFNEGYQCNKNGIDSLKGVTNYLAFIKQQTKPLSIESNRQTYGEFMRSNPSIKEEKVSTETLPEAAKSVIDNLTDTYTARNGKICHIEDENGEKMYIVPFDDIERLKAATEACQMHCTTGLDELIEWLESEVSDFKSSVNSSDLHVASYLQNCVLVKVKRLKNN